MSAPTKNLLDPVLDQVPKQFPLEMQIGVNSVPPIDWNTLLCSQQSTLLTPTKRYPDTVVLMPNGCRMGIWQLPTVECKVPTPPMGTLIINTFPAIYKERPTPTPVVPRTSPVWWVYPKIPNANELPVDQVAQAADFDLFDFLPMVYREADETDGSMQQWVWAFNQIWAELVYQAASFPSNTVFSGTTKLIKELCDARGNPFQFLDDNQLRRAADCLIHIYKRRGDNDGIVHTVWFLLGVRITIQYDYDWCWQLGKHRLGTETVLSSVNAPMFKVTIPSGVSDAVKAQVTAIVQFMKPANLQFIIT